MSPNTQKHLDIPQKLIKILEENPGNYTPIYQNPSNQLVYKIRSDIFEIVFDAISDTAVLKYQNSLDQKKIRSLGMLMQEANMILRKYAQGIGKKILIEVSFHGTYMEDTITLQKVSKLLAGRSI